MYHDDFRLADRMIFNFYNSKWNYFSPLMNNPHYYGRRRQFIEWHPTTVSFVDDRGRIRLDDTFLRIKNINCGR